MRWLWMLLLASFCFNILNAQFTAPPNPSQPPPGPADFLPIVFVNNSGLPNPDNQIHVVITGKDLTPASNQVFVKFNASGIGSLVVAAPGDNSLNYSQTLSQFPSIPGGRVAYVPRINSSLIFFSVDQALNMPVNPPNAIVQPNFTNPNDPNYNKNFDIFEFAFVNTPPNIAADATAVTFFSIPLYGFISTPSASSASNTGLFQPRDFIISQAKSFFASAPTASQWKNLILKNGSTNLRILSPGKAMTASPSLFDPNYLDNKLAYNYSYIEDIWTGSPSFYRTHPLNIQIPNGKLYTGTIQSDNTIKFTSGSNVVTFAAPTKTPSTTTENIFGGLPLYNSDNSGTGDGVQISKLFEEAIIAGLVPTADTLSEKYLVDHQSSYYTVNKNLSLDGQTTGPWFDLYSKALHSLGTIYTFAFDEPLWPQVLITSDTLASNTYLGITIGNLTNLPTTTTILTTSSNPTQEDQMVTFTVKVTNDSSTPTGNVTFSVDGVATSIVPLTNGRANFQTSNLPTGSHTIVANYSGDPNHFASVSAPFTIVITSFDPTTTTALASSSNPAQVGQELTFTAKVTSGSSIPTGSVTFSIDGVVVATVPLTNRGRASFQMSSLPIGSHLVIADYSGDATHRSSSASLIEIIKETIVFPPRRLEINQVANKFATQEDLINIITWKAPKQGSPPVAYRIYRDQNLTKLAAVISNQESLQFKDHNRKKGKTYHYFIVSVDALGQFSSVVEISLKG